MLCTLQSSLVLSLFFSKKIYQPFQDHYEKSSMGSGI